MSITIELEPEIEATLRSRAEQEGLNPAQYVGVLLRDNLLSPLPQSKDALSQEIEAMQNRTPEQIAAARERILSRSRRAIPLPPGKTLEDMVYGKWPGTETDDEINAALEELS